MPSLKWDCVPIPHFLWGTLRLFEIIVGGAFGGLCFATESLLEAGTKRDGVEESPKEDGDAAKNGDDAKKSPKEEKGGNAKTVEWLATRGATVTLYSLGQAAIGIGGAFAGIFGMLTIGNAVHAGSSDQILATDFLYIGALSVVSGFVGNRILRGVGDKFARDLSDVKQTANEAESTSTKAQKTALGADKRATNAEERALKAEQMANQARAMILDIFIARDLVDMLEACKKNSQQPKDGVRSKAEEVLSRLEKYKASFPTERILNIVLANLKFELGLTDQAFAQLQEFIANRNKAGLKEGDDDATAWFNMACYHALLSREPPPADSEQRKAKAKDALAECLKIARTCGPEELNLRMSRALEDDDLRPLMQTPPFQALIEEFKKNS